VTATFTPSTSYAITYTKAGTGSGIINFAPTGSQASCSTSCSNTYATGSVVTLSAAPAAGSTFTGWSGGCTGTAVCQLTMSAAKAVTATFKVVPIYAITYTKVGTGSGTTSFWPTGTQASCAASCVNSYASGSVVTLTAAPSTGSTFTGWSGGCTGATTCQLTLSAAKAVTATYTLLPSYAIAYTKAGSGSGTTSFSPAGTRANCAASCSNSYTSGSVVTLTASPATGSSFSGWSGGCTGDGACQLTLSAAQSVTATFTTLSSTCAGLGCALDNSLTWQSYLSDSNPFYSQSTYTSGASGSTAARSGYTINSGYSCVYTTIDGPGTLSYIWGVSSEAGYDYLRFYYDNSLQDFISGSGVNVGSWYQNVWSITASGAHTIEFCYEKDSSVASFLDAGFVDKVSFVPSGVSPKFTSQDKHDQIKRLEMTPINRPEGAVTQVPEGQPVKKGRASGMQLRSPRSR
jgi:hypothetical protein